jgi:hypothetical protein
MSTSIGPLSTQAGLELLQAPLPENLPREKQPHLPAVLPTDPSSSVGANPNNVITRNQERIQEEAEKSAITQTQLLNFTT